VETFRLKIVSFIIVPVLMFSISGIGFHLHYCNTQKKLLANLHPAGINNQVSSCCNYSEAEGTCCNILESHETFHVAGPSDCCIDVYASVKTDEDYISKNLKIDFYPAAFSLPYTNIDNSLKKSPPIYADRVNFEPPDMLSTVVMLL
jgi:hypothetical protein